MDKKTKVIVAILIIIVIILTIYVGTLIYSLNNTNEVEENNVMNEEQEITTENIVNQNEITKENIVKDNSIEENTSIEQKVTVDNSNNITGKEESDSQTSNQGLSNDEKAIQLAKNKYGNVDNTVKFNIANKDGDEYYISVNNITTTRSNSMV